MHVSYLFIRVACMLVTMLYLDVFLHDADVVFFLFFSRTCLGRICSRSLEKHNVDDNTIVIHDEDMVLAVVVSAQS